jgi:hypothetical protein
MPDYSNYLDSALFTKHLSKIQINFMLSFPSGCIRRSFLSKIILSQPSHISNSSLLGFSILITLCMYVSMRGGSHPAPAPRSSLIYVTSPRNIILHPSHVILFLCERNKINLSYFTSPILVTISKLVVLSLEMHHKTTSYNPRVNSLQGSLS